MSEKLLWAVQNISKADFHARPQTLRFIAKKCGVECKAVYFSALNDANPKARIAALEIYREYFPSECLEVSRSLVDDKDWRVRRKAKKLFKEV